MSSTMKKNLLIAAIVVIVGGVWALFELRTKPANDKIQSGVRKIVDQEPRVKPLYDQAMTDGVLTILEANEIVDKANELKGK